MWRLGNADSSNSIIFLVHPKKMFDNSSYKYMIAQKGITLVDDQQITLFPATVFYSYAHEDEPLRGQLEKHLSSLRRQGIIKEWHHRKILPGADWSDEIDSNLMAASIILLLISPDFLATDYNCSVEMCRALQRHDAGDAHVIPILLRPVEWQGEPFGKLSCLPSNARPITLWPNRDKGFLDVARGIRKVAKELNAQRETNPSSDNRPLVRLLSSWSVPFRRNPSFTGREDVLNKIYTMFQAEKETELPLPLGLSGLGGIGKKQIGIEYAYRYRHEYKNVLWVQAETRETLELDFCRIAGILRLPEQNEKDQSIIIKAVKRWLETQERWLLILDNVEDLRMMSDYLPFANMGRALLTTRAQTMAGLARKIKIVEMELQDSISFLLRRASMDLQNSPLDNNAAKDYLNAKEIVQEMGRLPLALDQAGAYIEETRCSLSRYLSLYRTQQTQMLKRRGESASDHLEPVATTWSLNFQKIRHASPLAAQILHLCTFLAPDAIPEEIFTDGGPALGSKFQKAVTDAYVFDTAISELLKYSLLHRDSQTSTLTIHRLVQAAVKNDMNEGTQRRWAERAVRVLTHIFPDVVFGAWTHCQRYLSHVQVCQKWIEQYGFVFPEAARLLHQAGCYLDDRGSSKEAEGFFQQALAIREHTLGADHPDTASSLNNLAILSSKRGENEQAEALLQRALMIREQVLELDHPDTVSSLNNLAIIYSKRNEDDLAKRLFRKVFAIRERVLGSNHPDTASSLNNLAILYGRGGEREQAMIFAQKALSIRERMLGIEHPDTADSLDNLAILYASQGQDEQAEAFFQRALAIRERVLGLDNLDTANSFNNLAMLYSNRGRDDLAQLFFQKARTIARKVQELEDLHGEKVGYGAKNSQDESVGWEKSSLRYISATFLPVQPHFAYTRSAGSIPLWPRRYVAEDFSISLILEGGKPLALIGFVTHKGTAIEALHGIPVILSSQDNKVYTQIVDGFGNFIFESILPATYKLELQLVESVIVIDQLLVMAKEK